MKKKTALGLVVALVFGGAALFGSPASGAAQGPVRIGMITTLSGGGASLGIDIRDGFMLVLTERDGALGGVPTELTVVDDDRDVGTAKSIARRLLQREGVEIVTGIVWSNLALAVVPTVTRAGKFYISPNAGPSLLAGKRCDPNYFNVAYQNDNLHEAAGQTVTDRGYATAYLLAPNYPAGHDSLTGFKRYYKGEIVGEVYTALGQVDYAAEIANLRAAAPEAVFFFLPGGMGINFVKQYAQAGLTESIPLFGPAFSFDQGILKAVGEAAVGVINTAQWSPDLDNPANRHFVEAFRQAYGRSPSLYAAQAYDAALLVDSAIAAVGGDMSRSDDFRAALERADFESVRGEFRFGPNHHPIQDIYARVVVNEDGFITNRLVSKVFEDHQDAYAAECRMP